MQLIQTVAEMQAHADAARAEGRRLALVPTMGALHRGHLALVDAARWRGSHITVSIFVNPTQFGPNEDYDAYPRTLEADLAALEGKGADAVFAPSAAEMYPLGLPPLTTVRVDKLGDHLCGPFRPGHFEGVASVVSKLFLACRPHVAIFGQKDAQQLAVLRRMAADLNFGIDVVGHPIVREDDGLAMSSRNRYLSADEREEALVIRRALLAAEAAVAAGERRADRVIDAMQAELAGTPGVRPQYAELVDADTLQPVDALAPGRYLAAIAAYAGTTRLIDNTEVVVLEPSGAGSQGA